jgi:hypothetical protein
MRAANPWIFTAAGQQTHNALDNAKEQGEPFRRMRAGLRRYEFVTALLSIRLLCCTVSKVKCRRDCLQEV